MMEAQKGQKIKVQMSDNVGYFVDLRRDEAAHKLPSSKPSL